MTIAAMLDVRRADCKPARMVVFPEPHEADDNGLLAAGGDLSPQTLLAAYRKGIFPWYEAGGPILWWSPDPRMTLFPHRFHCSRRLARRMRQRRFRLSMNEDFSGVIRGCAARAEGTWIHPGMMTAYQRLFELGVAQSVETWLDDALVGGLYGVRIGGVLFAESMFSRVADASKMALAWLCGADSELRLIDCQFYTDHLASLGAREMPRTEFLACLVEFGASEAIKK